MSHPIEPERFKTLTPSTRAEPAPKNAAPKERHYTMTVQRKDRSGRWSQVATWKVTTTEEDMQGPLQMGLKDNYRLIIKEGPPEVPNA